LALSAAGAFAAGGALLASRAWHQAWRPPLRILFETIALDERANQQRAGRVVPVETPAPMVLSGLLTADAAPTMTGGVSLAMQVDWAGRLRGGGGRTDSAANPAAGGVLLTVLGSLTANRMHEWRAGRRIRVAADLRRPARYLDPGVPDQERGLARRGVTLVGSVKSAALVDVEARGSRLAESAANLRAFTRRAIADTVGRLSSRSAAIVNAIVIGDRSGLDDEVERRLQEAGIYHVIAISGGNIAILAGITLTAFRLVGWLGRAAMVSAAAGLVAYGYLVGGGASVDRATLMAVVYLAGRAWDMRGPPLQPLVLVAGLLVLADPLSVVDPAALLTFGASAAIIAVAPSAPLNRLPRILAPVAALLVATTAAEAALLPVSAAIFSRVTFAGLLLNFAAIPLMAVAQLAGMVAVPIYAVWPTGARLAGLIAHLGAEGLVRTADLVARAPWSTWRVVAPSPIAVCAYYGSLVLAWVSWRFQRRDESEGQSAVVRFRLPAVLGDGSAGYPPARGVRVFRSRRRRLSLLASTVAAGLWIVADPRAWLDSSGDGRLHVTFIDVGQGDAALVRFPRGTPLLIDAGGLVGSASFDVGDRVVAPVLRSAGIRRLGVLALSHGDADHIGGAPAILREFRPWDVWEGVPVPASVSLQHVRASAVETGARWTTVQRADQFLVDDVRVVVRHPQIADWERRTVRNDDSMVIELRWKDASFVFTGDISRESEQQIAPQFAPSPLRVLKVPHHGSATSSSDPFVRALSPAVAVVSVGRSNTFGHPAPAVLGRYAAVRTALFRTDVDGAVTVDTDGASLDVHAFTGRTLHLERRAKPAVAAPVL
jgi:competence protein ComEC